MSHVLRVLATVVLSAAALTTVATGVASADYTVTVTCEVVSKSGRYRTVQAKATGPTWKVATERATASARRTLKTGESIVSCVDR
ncbi:hypothetical protein [Nocardia bovistercoris]|uniref:Secreted protein n=1 Tax=Nocardia bovistercoris TaxID=2785916 RepID=A0A931IGJ4_9NOCA|nr:hypothetical protein [Nocardia bovistercoris]MBH0780956.1 hypothetical protein [Nocardia bovistercoris]